MSNEKLKPFHMIAPLHHKGWIVISALLSGCWRYEAQSVQKIYKKCSTEKNSFFEFSKFDGNFPHFSYIIIW